MAIKSFPEIFDEVAEVQSLSEQQRLDLSHFFAAAAVSGEDGWVGLDAKEDLEEQVEKMRKDPVLLHAAEQVISRLETSDS